MKVSTAISCTNSRNTSACTRTRTCTRTNLLQILILLSWMASTTTTITNALSSSSSSSSSPNRNGNRRSPPRNRRGARTGTSSSDAQAAGTGPKSDSTRERRQRRPRTSTSTSAGTRTSANTSSDAQLLAQPQTSNHNSTPFDLYNASREREHEHKRIQHPHIQQFSLDDIFPDLNFSQVFCHNEKFRTHLRVAMREDIFYTTPNDVNSGSGRGEGSAFVSKDQGTLRGTWNCIPKQLPQDGNGEVEVPMRMTRLTQVLQDALGTKAPSGDEFMMTLGRLCGVNPSCEWIDIMDMNTNMNIKSGIEKKSTRAATAAAAATGIKSHSWRQDHGRSYDHDSNYDDDDVDYDGHLKKSRYTVQLGFPMEDGYTGTGVFQHVIKLTHEHIHETSALPGAGGPADDRDDENGPILWDSTFNGNGKGMLLNSILIEEECITRPAFGVGKEIIRWRDVDVLHSEPDVVYRQSLMRFM